MRAIGLVVAVLLAIPEPAAAQDQKQFRDWYVACDNLRNCSAYGFDTELSGFSYLRLERGGGADAQPKITVTVQVPQDATFTLAFDDPKLPGLPSTPQTGQETDSDESRRVTIAFSDALIESLRKANTIVVTRERKSSPPLKDDEKRSAISLTGAVAALLWIDEQQKRLDTATALIRRGPKPASAVPPQAKAPVIVAAKAAAAKAPKPAPDLLVKARKACEDDTSTKLQGADALTAGLFLYQYHCPDMSGAYNMNSVYFIVPAGQPQAARPVNFRWPIQVGDTMQDGEGQIATNSSFNPKTLTLTTFSKGRGIGDCGTEENWVFDGKTFRLAELKVMADCRGVLSEDWPVVFRAEVKR